MYNNLWGCRQVNPKIVCPNTYMINLFICCWCCGVPGPSSRGNIPILAGKAYLACFRSNHSKLFRISFKLDQRWFATSSSQTVVNCLDSLQDRSETTNEPLEAFVPHNSQLSNSRDSKFQEGWRAEIFQKFSDARFTASCFSWGFFRPFNPSMY